MLSLFFLITRPPPRSTLFPYTTLFRSYALPGTVLSLVIAVVGMGLGFALPVLQPGRAASLAGGVLDRKSTRLNSSHLGISYAVFCLKKKRTNTRCTY